MESYFDVHASVPIEVWNIGQLQAQKAHLSNTLDLVKSRVFHSNPQIRLICNYSSLAKSKIFTLELGFRCCESFYFSCEV